MSSNHWLTIIIIWHMIAWPGSAGTGAKLFLQTVQDFHFFLSFAFDFLSSKLSWTILLLTMWRKYIKSDECILGVGVILGLKLGLVNLYIGHRILLIISASLVSSFVSRTNKNMYQLPWGIVRIADVSCHMLGPAPGMNKVKKENWSPSFSSEKCS